MGEQLIITFGRPRGGGEGGPTWGGWVWPGEDGCHEDPALDVCGCVEDRKKFYGGTYASAPRYTCTSV